ncbi:MAG: hypothetical protein Kow00108_11520 [Calditrichia bacterium]
MHINTDINILGGLPDWNLVLYFYDKKYKKAKLPLHTFIKTTKSVKRFESAISGTLLKFKNKKIKVLFDSMISSEGITKDTMLFLFWNAALNNEFFHFLNENVFFPALYSGRIQIRHEEVVACLHELKSQNGTLKNWSETTIRTTASKYLTLLKKFGLLEGKQNKSIVQPFLNEKMFVIFIYWLTAVSEKTNLLLSPMLQYGFMELPVFTERVTNKKFAKYFNIYYTGDNLKIEPKIEYEKLYEIIIRN